MVNLIAIIILLAQPNNEPINIQCTIRDSISHDSIPLVQITFENLGKSFKTRQSNFYVSLPSATYNLVLEADEYEKLVRSIDVSSESDSFVFEMVKASDRVWLGLKQDTLNIHLDSLDNALKKRELQEAKRLIAVVENYNCSVSVLDSIHKSYDLAKTAWSDSFLQIAQELEDSTKFADAYYYYKKIVDIDSLNETALKKLDEIDNKITGLQKGDTLQPPKETPAIDHQTIKKMYNEALSKFFSEDYNGALKLFKTILRYDPTYESARKYLKKTEARLKVLKKG